MADGTLIFDTKLDNSGLKQGLNEADSGFAKTGAMASKFGKAAAAGAVAAGAAMVALGKKSLELYSEYEQLKGGVETLFKGSSDTVLKYAQDAYKTAGMSANQYMDTVTSFSASLIQSLGGDTKKAAEVGNQAVIDMSDNANKMGTDIGRIQDAYQGFAKQNYTMLDNLKLGYGGTKTEMERLLTEAEKLTGKKYDISNFADITEAIHAIQTEMGITGTTSREAADTIQGSIGMMKSAWANLLTGLADPEADIDKLVQNLITSVEAVAKNIIPKIPMVFKGIIEAIKGLAPLIPPMIEQMKPVIMSALTSLAGWIKGQIMNLFSSFGGAVVGSLAGILSIGLIIGKLAGVFSTVMTVFNTLKTVIMGVRTAFMLFNAVLMANPIFLIIAAIVALVAIFVVLYNKCAWFRNAVNTVISAVVAIFKTKFNMIKAVIMLIISVITSMVAKIRSAFNAVKSAVISMASAVVARVQAIAAGFRSMISKVVSICQKVVSTFKALPGKIKAGLGSLFRIGADFIAGFIKGIKSKWQDVTSWIQEKISAIPSKIKSILGIGSPSKVMAEVGKWIPAGLAVGIEDNFDPVDEAMTALGNITATGFTAPDFAAGRSAGIAARIGRTAQTQAIGEKVVNQTINFNQPVNSPAETARALRNEARFGLLGGTI